MLRRNGGCRLTKFCVPEIGFRTDPVSGESFALLFHDIPKRTDSDLFSILAPNPILLTTAFRPKEKEIDFLIPTDTDTSLCFRPSV